MSEDVEVIKAMPIRYINVEIYADDKVITLRISDGQGECLSPISGKTLKELGESIREMLDQYPEMESWDMPESMRQLPDAAH